MDSKAYANPRNPCQSFSQVLGREECVISRVCEGMVAGSQVLEKEMNIMCHRMPGIPTWKQLPDTWQTDCEWLVGLVIS